jgi:hypothetical protein
MNGELATIDDRTLFNLVTNGDCSKLDENGKLAYYKARCDAAGVDPRTSPFQFLLLNGKQVLYATKGCTDQLASKNKIACEVLSQVTESGLRVVTVRSRTADGRQTDEIGAVNVEGMKGDQLANAYMKAVTKAKRRAILSICGLGMLDETEIETIKDAVAVPVETRKPEPAKIVHDAKPAPTASNGQLVWVDLIQDIQEREIEIKTGKDKGSKKRAFKIIGVDGFECSGFINGDGDSERLNLAKELKNKQELASIVYRKTADGKYNNIVSIEPPMAGEGPDEPGANG